MTDPKKYLIVQNGYKLSYDTVDCFVNDKAVLKETGSTKSSKEIAEELQKKFYDTFLKKHFKNLIVLSAAGTSLDNGGNKGKTRQGLWLDCQAEIEEVYALCSKIKDKKFETNFDIEGFLTALILHEKVNEILVDKDGKSIKAKIEKKIATACELKLDNNKAPHINFLNKITARKSSDARVQLFTTNYDTLFEQAANESGFVIIDGFSFTQPRKFSGRFYDFDIVNREKTRIKQEESFVSKVFHLYKLHGSLNWTKKTDSVFQEDNPTEPLVIYPASEKYESSYEQPYFEMMSRFQQSLRKDNTLLIVIGFGFQDKHIQNVIIEAVQQNPSFQLLIVNYNGSGGIETNFMEKFFNDTGTMEVKRNVNIIFNTFSEFTKNYPANQTYIDPSKTESNDTL
jgi:hypothetical protein